MALTDVDKVKQYLHIADSKTQHDTLLQRLIEYLGARLRRYLSRDIEHKTLTAAIFDGLGRNALQINQYPITAVTDIRIDADQVFADSTALTLLNDIRRSPIKDEAGLILRTGSAIWPKGIGNIQVDLAGGFQNIPEDIEHAIVLTASEFFNQTIQLRTGQSGAPITSESIGRDESTSYQLQWDKWTWPGPARAVLASLKHTL